MPGDESRKVRRKSISISYSCGCPLWLQTSSKPRDPLNKFMTALAYSQFGYQGALAAGFCSSAIAPALLY